MSEPAGSRGDDRIVARIGLLLQSGVTAAALVIVAGGILYLVRHGGDPVADRSTFVPEPAEYSRPAAIFREAWHGGGRALIQVGLLLLIATPVLRVAFSVLAFAWQRDWVYVLIPLIVLCALLYGLFSGHLY